MKCYICNKPISSSIRVFMEAKNKREKSQFRDLCSTCYERKQESEGYVREGNYWRKRRVE